MSSIFFCADDYDVGNLRVDKGTKRVEMNKIEKDKIALAREVEEKVGPGTELCEELESFVAAVRSSILGEK
jgi:hypothetical protein